MLSLALQLNLYNYRFLNSDDCAGNGNREPMELEEMDIERVSGNAITVFPNPLSSETAISFTLIQSENVSLKIFDVNGRLIKIITDAVFEEGKHTVAWSAGKVKAGIYFLQMQSEEFVKTEKLIVTE